MRLPGERDLHYHTRVDSAFTGYAGSSRFAIGLQDVRLLLLHGQAEAAADSAAAAAGSEAPAP